jgi:hypothetical protein
MLHPLAQFDEVSGISSVMLASDDVFDVIREAWLAEQEVAESSELGIGPADGALFKARPAILYKPSYWTSIVVRDGDAWRDRMQIWNAAPAPAK